MAAAVIELNSLPDAIGSAAEDNDFLVGRRRSLILFFVGRIEIGSVTLKLGRARIHEFEYWLDSVLRAQVPNLLRGSLVVPDVPAISKSGIGDAHALCLPHQLRRNRIDGMLLNFPLHLGNLSHLLQKPWIDS